MASKINICVFTRTWLSSGAGLFPQELMPGLLAAGANVTFVAPRAEKEKFEEPQPGLRRIRQPRERRDNSPKPVRVAASLARVIGGFIGMMRARLTNRVFIIHVPDPLIFAVPMLAILRITGARIIFIAHDPLPHAWSLPPALRSFERWMHGACYDLASRVVVLSEAPGEKIREAYPKMKQPIVVIPHGVHPLDHDSDTPGTGQLLAFGTIRRNKGILEAIGGAILAARRGVPVRLLVAGEPHKEDADYGRECVELAATAPEVIDAQIRFIENDELETMFEQSDALLLPYQAFFSQSGVAMLAASNGRPIVATRAGGIDTLIADGLPASVISEPGDAEAVAVAIQAFYARPIAQWREEARQYRDLARARWSWMAIGRQYVDLARDVDRN